MHSLQKEAQFSQESALGPYGMYLICTVCTGDFLRMAYFI